MKVFKKATDDQAILCTGWKRRRWGKSVYSFSDFYTKLVKACKASSEIRRIPSAELRCEPLSPGPEYVWFFRLI